MILYTKHPASPEMVAHMKEKGGTLLLVACTQYYVIDHGIEQPLEELMREWFVEHRGRYHAFRDGSHLGGGDEVTEVKVLTQDGRVIDLRSPSPVPKAESASGNPDKMP